RYGRSIEKSLTEVNKRHDIFLRSLHLSTLLGGLAVGQKITDPQFREASALNKVIQLRDATADVLKGYPWSKVLLVEHDIPTGPESQLYFYSSVRVVHSKRPVDGTYLTEYRSYSPTDDSSLRRVGDIARILQGMDLSMAILPCRGFRPLPA